MNILSSFRLIKTFVFDMDGVLTDGGLLIDSNGQWLRRMDIKDGYALQLAIKSGYKIIVISGSESEYVVERLRKLGIGDIFMTIISKKIIAGRRKFYLWAMIYQIIIVCKLLVLPVVLMMQQ